MSASALEGRAPACPLNYPTTPDHTTGGPRPSIEAFEEELLTRLDARSRTLVPELGIDLAALSARFRRANKKCEEQIVEIFETLRGLGL